MKRRSVLLACVGAVSAGTAGCLGRLRDTGEPTRLCVEGVDNRHTAPVEVEYRVLEDDTVLLDEAGTVEPEGFHRPGGEWTVGPGRYRVRMRLAGEAWEEVDTARTSGEHLAVFGRVDTVDAGGDPFLAIMRSRNPNACEW